MLDVIVVGLGIMGSAAAQHLASRGKRVLGIDQFAPPHTFGSSHGASRMIRQSYWEHPDYVPLLLRAYELWERLEQDSGADLLHLTGGLVIGSQTGDLVRRSVHSAELHSLPHEVLSAGELRRRYPPLRVADTDFALFETRAGYLRAEECWRQQLAAAARHGADLHVDERLLEWRVLADESVEVLTTRGRYQAGHLVLTAGPWASQLLRETGSPLSVTRQVLYWFETPSGSKSFLEDRFPVFLFESMDGSPMLYGFPETPDEPGVVKVAFHGSADVCSPDTVDRSIHPGEIERMRLRLLQCLPSVAGRCLRAQTCLYTMTPDEHFIVDTMPGFPSVTLACGFSGHGFKFANLIGEMIAEFTEGRRIAGSELFSAARFP